MKIPLFNYCLFLLICIPSILFGVNDNDGKYKKQKNISKIYTVTPNAKVNISNSYGNIDVITWEENTVSIEVSITTSGDNETKVQDKLDDITIKFNASPDYVSAKTNLNKSRSNSWSWWGGSNKVNMKINYIIKMPITAHINLDNNYGEINLDTIKGNVDIDCDYGKITTKELLSENNSITFDYSKGCYFEYINSGKIDADYSSFTVSKAKNLDIDADYTRSNIEIAETINYNINYNTITIGKVNSLNADGDYVTCKIDEVYKDVKIDATYGAIKINNLTKNVSSVFLDCNYTKITLGHDPMLNFNFEIELGYASLREAEHLNFIKKDVKTGNKYYSGFYGLKNSNTKINIDSGYGSVSIIKN